MAFSTGSLRLATQIHPLGWPVAAVIAASFAFMLPVAALPNAIVSSRRQITMPQMAHAGSWLNIIGSLPIALPGMTLLPFVRCIDLTTWPDGPAR